MAFVSFSEMLFVKSITAEIVWEIIFSVCDRIILTFLSFWGIFLRKYFCAFDLMCSSSNPLIHLNMSLSCRIFYNFQKICLSTIFSQGKLKFVFEVLYIHFDNGKYFHFYPLFIISKLEGDLQIEKLEMGYRFCNYFTEKSQQILLFEMVTIL